MPIFEYRCNKCGRKFEEIIRAEEDEFKMACPEPECNSKSFEKLMSASNFLKGAPATNSLKEAAEPKISEQTEIPNSGILTINDKQVEVDLVPATIHHPEGDIQATAICPKMKKLKKKETLN